MNDQELLDAAERVQDAASFVAFLEVLRRNWDAAVAAEQASPSGRYASMHGWENTNIGSFLDAAIAGARDNGFCHESGAGEAADAWKRAAEIMLLGKIYE